TAPRATAAPSSPRPTPRSHGPSPGPTRSPSPPATTGSRCQGGRPYWWTAPCRSLGSTGPPPPRRTSSRTGPATCRRPRTSSTRRVSATTGLMPLSTNIPPGAVPPLTTPEVTFTRTTTPFQETGGSTITLEPNAFISFTATTVITGPSLVTIGDFVWNDT